jgi:molecular chaperone DnaK (HSP70)
MSSSAPIPVGLDLSSLYCRVAIDGRGVISNTQGARFTLGYVAREEKEQDFVFGEAAQRLAGCNRIQTTSDSSSLEAFLSYLIQLAVDNAAVSADQLRLVVSVPDAINSNSDSLTELVNSVSNACKSLVTDKKKRGQELVLNVISKAAAVCVANNTLPKDGLILVLDMDGDSPLEWTLFQSQGGLLEHKAHRKLTDLSGPILLNLLASHVATQFERQCKLSRGVVMESSKAKAKLLKEAERVLLAAGGALSFMLDGFYEGMDCNVTISKPRWDMMTGNLLKQVEEALLEYQSNVQTVLLSGAWSFLLKPTIDKMFSGLVLQDAHVFPEEAVVLGCAKQAGMIQPGVAPLISSKTQVPVSPVSIGLLGPESPQVWIPQGMPLPAKVQCSVDKSCKLYQLTPTQVEIADLMDVDCETIVTVELSKDGQLSIGLPGQSVVTL